MTVRELAEAIEKLKEYEKILGKVRFDINSAMADLKETGDAMWVENLRAEQDRKKFEEQLQGMEDRDKI